MHLDQVSAAVPDTDLIAASAHSALMWEAELARVREFDKAGSWPTPTIYSFRQWLGCQWDYARTEQSELHERSLLTPLQAHRLWQRVIDNSPVGAQLISTRRVASWCEDAARALFDFSIAPEQVESREWTGDSRQFPAWYRQYRAECREHGWLDPATLLYTLNRVPESGPARNLLLLDSVPETPEIRLLEKRWREFGRSVASLRSNSRSAKLNAVTAATPADELSLVAAWSHSLLAKRTDARLAVITRDPALQRDELEAAFARYELEDRLSFAAGIPLAATGILGAALSALELLTPGSGFESLSRWLRSPFFGSADAGYLHRAAAFERQLRNDPRSQQDFAAAYQRFGLRKEFQRYLPDAVERLDRAFQRLPRSATPTSWAQIWQTCLRLLDWEGCNADPGEGIAASWDNTLGHFAELTPITGLLTANAALTEFGQLLARETTYARTPLSGVHVLSRMSDVGPGYSGVWITGFSDRSWPVREGANPLLPRGLRRRLGMPGIVPAEDLAYAEAELQQLLARVAEANFSCPLRILDQPQVPNPRFTDWVEREFARPVDRDQGEMETIADPAPPLADDAIPGGIRTLDLQSACPVRAFASARLGAEPLEQAARGISPRLRGILLHRSLELVFAHATSEERRHHLADCLQQAARKLLPTGDDNFAAQSAAELERLLQLIEALLTLDESRAPFEVIARELPAELTVAGRSLQCRIDRLDQLDDGSQVLLDYKSGRANAPDWFAERPGSVQLPVYVTATGSAAAAIANVTLNDETVAYRGAGPAAGALPGKQQQIDPEAWTRQLIRWREQLEGLVTEFASGDVRIGMAAAELADREYAALTRLREAPG